MKRIILCLAMMAPVALFAQKAQKATENTTTAQNMSNMASTRVQVKADLANRVEELNATLSRNNNERAQKVMQDMMASMQRYISMESINMEKGTETATKKKVDKLNAVYTDLKMMSVDPAQNQQGIQGKVDEFIKLM